MSQIKTKSPTQKYDNQSLQKPHPIIYRPLTRNTWSVRKRLRIMQRGLLLEPGLSATMTNYVHKNRHCNLKMGALAHACHRHVLGKALNQFETLLVQSFQKLCTENDVKLLGALYGRMTAEQRKTVFPDGFATLDADTPYDAARYKHDIETSALPYLRNMPIRRLDDPSRVSEEDFAKATYAYGRGITVCGAPRPGGRAGSLTAKISHIHAHSITDEMLWASDEMYYFWAAGPDSLGSITRNPGGDGHWSMDDGDNVWLHQTVTSAPVGSFEYLVLTTILMEQDTSGLADGAWDQLIEFFNIINDWIGSNGWNQLMDGFAGSIGGFSFGDIAGFFALLGLLFGDSSDDLLGEASFAFADVGEASALAEGGEAGSYRVVVYAE